MALPASPAFEALVAEHGRSVRRVCTSILRDEHLGADAAQETFVRLWSRMVEGRAPERFGGWLRRVAVTTSLDLLRRRPEADEAEPPEPAASDDPQALAARHELAIRSHDERRQVRVVEENHLAVAVSEQVGQLQSQNVALGFEKLIIDDDAMLGVSLVRRHG